MCELHGGQEQAYVDGGLEEAGSLHPLWVTAWRRNVDVIAGYPLLVCELAKSDRVLEGRGVVGCWIWLASVMLWERGS